VVKDYPALGKDLGMNGWHVRVVVDNLAVTTHLVQ